jgi:hypothetical protein
MKLLEIPSSWLQRSRHKNHYSARSTAVTEGSCGANSPVLTTFSSYLLSPAA